MRRLSKIERLHQRKRERGTLVERTFGRDDFTPSTSRPRIRTGKLYRDDETRNSSDARVNYAYGADDTFGVFS